MLFTSCFIFSRDEFEQAGVSFEEHINDEHNMWKYIWFQIYLELKDPLSFSAPEYSAFKQLGNKQVIRLVMLCVSAMLISSSTARTSFTWAR